MAGTLVTPRALDLRVPECVEPPARATQLRRPRCSFIHLDARRCAKVWLQDHVNGSGSQRLSSPWGFGLDS
eukprot:scaffold159755_cov32-Tisochrysis_lutea.AAC.2